MLYWLKNSQKVHIPCLITYGLAVEVAVLSLLMGFAAVVLVHYTTYFIYLVLVAVVSELLRVTLAAVSDYYC